MVNKWNIFGTIIIFKISFYIRYINTHRHFLPLLQFVSPHLPEIGLFNTKSMIGIVAIMFR